MFCVLFEAMPAKRTSLKWLHLKNVLARIFEPKYETYLCLTEENHCNIYLCSYIPLIMKLSYLSDTFEKMNTLNT